jgi:outer membrane protein OmpA-like peptidoglycan-associated protein
MMFSTQARRSGDSIAQNPNTERLPQEPDRDSSNGVWHRLATRLQAKLNINAPADPFEREADLVADKIMRMPMSARSREPTVTRQDSQAFIQRQCAGCGSGEKAETILEEKEALQSKRESGHSPSFPSVGVQEQVKQLGGGGQPLAESDRAFFEPRFGRDFSNVRVDTSAQAADAARMINAKAFTMGNYIAFGAAQYSPGTDSGGRLLAHELTHTVQQGAATSIRRRRLSGFDESVDEEIIKQRSAGQILQRAPDDEAFAEEAEKNTERSAEKSFSATSPGLTATETPGEKFLLMNFAIREAALKKEHHEFLSTVYFGTLTSDPMASIEIVGHADSTGSGPSNDKLSRKRAQQVEKALRQMGAHNLRIKTVRGRGERDPIAPSDLVAGRAKNRRVEILVTSFKPSKPVPQILKELQKGMKPFVVKVDNFAACPFKDTVKSVVEDAFKPVQLIQFDWEGKSTAPEAFISFDDTTAFTTALGLTGDIFLHSFRNNEICRTPGDATTCEKVFPETADVMGRAIANTVAHETGHAFALDHVPATDNYMWTPELHPLHGKPNKTFAQHVLLKRTLQSVPETFNDSQLVHIVNRIKEQRKQRKPGVIEFE